MERLELLGDSVLKYVVTCHLFLKFPDKDEGQLSSSRADIISNAALHGRGIEHNIQVNCILSWEIYTMLHLFSWSLTLSRTNP
jgi:dsRNA-specific ribonuclease